MKVYLRFQPSSPLEWVDDFFSSHFSRFIFPLKSTPNCNVHLKLYHYITHLTCNVISSLVPTHKPIKVKCIKWLFKNSSLKLIIIVGQWKLIISCYWCSCKALLMCMPYCATFTFTNKTKRSTPEAFANLKEFHSA